MRFSSLFLLLVFHVQVSAFDDYWPKQFISFDEREHDLVVLYEDGSAARSARIVRGVDYPDAFIASRRASWKWCESKHANTGKRCLQIISDGVPFNSTHTWQGYYWYQDSKIVERLKHGPGKILYRYKDLE